MVRLPNVVDGPAQAPAAGKVQPSSTRQYYNPIFANWETNDPTKMLEGYQQAKKTNWAGEFQGDAAWRTNPEAYMKWFNEREQKQDWAPERVYRTTPENSGNYNFQNRSERGDAMQVLPQVQRLLQDKQVNQLRSEGYQNEIFDKARSNSYQNLAQNMRDTRLNAARRGLLDSGIREGAEAQAIGNTGLELGQMRQDIRSGAEQQAQGIENVSAKYGFDMQATQQAMEDSIYKQALQNAMAKRQGIGGLLGTVGSIGGMVYGNAIPGGGAYGAREGGRFGRDIGGRIS